MTKKSFSDVNNCQKTEGVIYISPSALRTYTTQFCQKQDGGAKEQRRLGILFRSPKKID